MVSREIAVIEERHRSMSDQTNNLGLENARLSQEVESTRKSLDELEDERATIETELEEGQKKSVELKTRLDDLVQQKNRKEAAINDYRRRISQVENTLVQLQSQIEDRTSRRKAISG